jgi:hypothetical protein
MFDSSLTLSLYVEAAVIIFTNSDLVTGADRFMFPFSSPVIMPSALTVCSAVEEALSAAIADMDNEEIIRQSIRKTDNIFDFIFITIPFFGNCAVSRNAGISVPQTEDRKPESEYFTFQTSLFL